MYICFRIWVYAVAEDDGEALLFGWLGNVALRQEKKRFSSTI